MSTIYDVIKRPLLTEKCSRAMEKFNRYAFEVSLSSTKHQIKNAVEKLFEVKVLEVKTSVVPGKVKRVGRFTKKLGKSKKAFVKLADGQEIEIYKGV